MCVSYIHKTMKLFTQTNVEDNAQQPLTMKSTIFTGLCRTISFMKETIHLDGDVVITI